MEKIKTDKVIIVEGKYDKIKLSSVVDAHIVTTDGFALFNNAEKRALIRKLAEKNGLVVLTDSDGAGFVIRNRIKSSIPQELVKHAYIPDIYGKEKRKRKPGKEGKLGVEGMPPQVIEDVLRRAGATFLGAGATFLGEGAGERTASHTTKADLFAAGLTGGEGSAQRRLDLLKRLELPEHMSANALLAVLNGCYTAEEVKELLNL